VRSLKWVARISCHSINFHGYLLFQILPTSNKKVKNGANSLMPWNKVCLSLCKFSWNLSFLNIILQRMPKSHFMKIQLSSHNNRPHIHRQSPNKVFIFTSLQNVKCEIHTCVRLTSRLLSFVGLSGNYIFHFIAISCNSSSCISSIFRNDPY
jgi:hypothetical protein